MINDTRAQAAVKMLQEELQLQKNLTAAKCVITAVLGALLGGWIVWVTM